jgi:4-hydroxy-3-methylbut-2-enyl diphosphate reductase
VQARFPHIRTPKQQDICYATQNRQDAVKLMARQVDGVVVVGSPTSSNTNRLRELAERLGVPALMVEDATEIPDGWLDHKVRVGVTAGASAPENLVQGVVRRLKEMGAVSVRSLDGVKETTQFPLPKGLRLDSEA